MNKKHLWIQRLGEYGIEKEAEYRIIFGVGGLRIQNRRFKKWDVWEKNVKLIAAGSTERNAGSRDDKMCRV